MFLDQKLISAIIFEVNDSSLNYSLRPCTSIATVRVYGSSTFSVVHCGGDVEFTDGEVEHGD